jgi:hypothetical protein
MARRDKKTQSGKPPRRGDDDDTHARLAPAITLAHRLATVARPALKSWDPVDLFLAFAVIVGDVLERAELTASRQDLIEGVLRLVDPGLHRRIVALSADARHTFLSRMTVEAATLDVLDHLHVEEDGAPSMEMIGATLAVLTLGRRDGDASEALFMTEATAMTSGRDESLGREIVRVASGFLAHGVTPEDAGMLAAAAVEFLEAVHES